MPDSPALPAAEIERQTRDRARLEAHLHLAMQAAGAGLWEYDHLADRHHWSTPLLRLLGEHEAPPATTLADWLERLHPEDRANFLGTVERVVNHPLGSYELDYRVRHRSGHWLWVNDRGRVIERAEDGSPLLTAGILTDISARKQAELAERELAERYAATFRASPAAVALTRFGDGCFIEMNERCAETFGWPRDEMIGKSSVELGIWPDRASREAWREQLRRTGHLSNYETTVLNRDHETRIVTLSAEVLSLSGETCILLFIVDITERRRAEIALQRNNRALQLMEQISRSLGRSTTEYDMYTQVCNVAVDSAGYAMAWIGLAVHDAAKSVRVAALSGNGHSYLQSAHITWHEDNQGSGPVGRAIRTGVPVFSRDIANDPSFGPWQVPAMAHGYQSTFAFPLRVDGEIIGAIGLYANEVDGFDDEEIALLENIIGELCSGISSLRARAAQLESEALLRGREQIFSAIVQQARDSIVLIDAYTLHFVEFSESAHQELGYSRDEFAQLTLADVQGSMDAPTIRQKIDQLLAVGNGEFETLHRRKNGGLRETRVGIRIIDIHGRKFLSAVWVDISQQKQQEKTLRDNEAALREAQSIAHVGSWTLHIPSGELQWSEETCRVFDVPLGMRVTLNDFLAKVHPEDRAEVETEWAAALQGKAYDIEHRIMTGDQIRWVRERARLRFNEQGEAIQAMGTVQDITERRETEDVVRKLLMAVEQSPNSIVITNLDAQIEYVNAAFSKVTGYTRKEAIGLNPRTLHSGLTPTQTYTELWDTLTQGLPWKGEFINRKKNGDIYYEFAQISPVRQPDGRISHYLAIKEDITEKKRITLELEQHRHNLEKLVQERTAELNQARLAAESASLAKSAFLANMSHEIRTPMNAIIGLTHLAQRSTSDTKVSDKLVKVSDAAHHLLSIINQILDISKIESGHLVLERTDFELARVIENTSMLVADRLQSRGLAFIRQIDPHLPGILHGDPLRLGQIILNFLSNAAKFTERGSVTLSARQISEDDAGLLVRFSVSDTGIGIDTEVQQRIFQAFEQADVSTTRRFGGTGLGLAISKRLAHLMGGEIGLESTPGQGSSFWFTARLLRGSQPVAAPETYTTDDAERLLARQHGQARILLAEDNLINQEVALDLLRGAGLQVDLAENGAQAVNMLHQMHYDLILMDVQMPVMDGLEATRTIRATERGARIPILAMTANAFGEDRRQCIEAGMNDHVAKPVDPENLFATLIKWLPKRSDCQATPGIPSNATGKAPDLRTQLTSIPGIDLEIGLQAVRGREGSYIRLLRKFAEMHRSNVERIRAALSAGDTEGARREAHSVKGAAGTLGLQSIQGAAATLELGIKEHQPEGEITAHCAELEHQLHQVCDQLLAKLPTEPV